MSKLRQILLDFDNAPTGTDELALKKFKDAEAAINQYVAEKLLDQHKIYYPDCDGKCGAFKIVLKRAGINPTEGSAS